MYVYIYFIYIIRITIFIKIKNLSIKLLKRTMNKNCVKMRYDMSSSSRDGFLCRNTYQVFNTVLADKIYQELLILHSSFSYTLPLAYSLTLTHVSMLEH